MRKEYDTRDLLSLPKDKSFYYWNSYGHKPIY
jgi:hypothetical protein